MELVNEDSFDFRKPINKKTNLNFENQKTFFIGMGILISIAICILMLLLTNSDRTIDNQTQIRLYDNYVKNVSQKWDLIYNEKTSMGADYYKLGQAIKENDEDGILMYYTLLKARTDIITMSYIRKFDLEIFSTHSVKIGKKMTLDSNHNDSTIKSYKLSESLIAKMKKVYLSRPYPAKLEIN